MNINTYWNLKRKKEILIHVNTYPSRGVYSEADFERIIQQSWSRVGNLESRGLHSNFIFDTKYIDSHNWKVVSNSMIIVN